MESLILNADKGATKLQKFKNIEDYDRYCKLQKMLRDVNSLNEYTAIQNLLEEENIEKRNIDEVNVRILTLRKEVMDREIQVKTSETR